MKTYQQFSVPLGNYIVYVDTTGVVRLVRNDQEESTVVLYDVNNDYREILDPAFEVERGKFEDWIWISFTEDDKVISTVYLK